MGGFQTVINSLMANPFYKLDRTPILEESHLIGT